MSDLLKCPRGCGLLVKRIQRYGPEGLEVDHCTLCGGTWFDGGEAERLVQAEIALRDAMKRKVTT